MVQEDEDSTGRESGQEGQGWGMTYLGNEGLTGLAGDSVGGGAVLIWASGKKRGCERTSSVRGRHGGC